MPEAKRQSQKGRREPCFRLWALYARAYVILYSTLLYYTYTYVILYYITYKVFEAQLPSDSTLHPDANS